MISDRLPSRSKIVLKYGRPVFKKKLITLSVHKQLVVWVSPKLYYLSRDGLSCDLKSFHRLPRDRKTTKRVWDSTRSQVRGQGPVSQKCSCLVGLTATVHNLSLRNSTASLKYQSISFHSWSLFSELKPWEKKHFMSTFISSSIRNPLHTSMKWSNLG